jgi:type I restriction enzyme, S subunit
MRADKPSHYLPKLRFPEFRDDPIWLTPLLTELYAFKRTNTLPRDELNYAAGTIKNIHYGDIHTKFKPLFRVENEHVPYVNPDTGSNGFSDDAFCEEGDIVLADASEDLGDVGKAIEVVSLGGERVIAGTHTILATRRGSVPVVGFGGQVFQSAAVRAGIKKEAQGAKVYGISANRISAVPVPLHRRRPSSRGSPTASARWTT